MTQLENRTELIGGFQLRPPSPLDARSVCGDCGDLDGEDDGGLRAVIGYLAPQGMEKIRRTATNVMFVPYVTGWDFSRGMVSTRRITGERP